MRGETLAGGMREPVRTGVTGMAYVTEADDSVGDTGLAVPIE